MTRLGSLLLVGAGLAACAGADAPVAPSDVPALQAATTHNRVRQVVIADVVVLNPCNGESIQLHIDQLFLLHELTVEGKFFHGHLTFLDRGTRGVGLGTGAVYHQVGAEQDFLHIKGEVEFQERVHNTINLISQGPVPNFIVVEIFRIKVSPTGVVTLLFDKLKQVCRG
jgi:hypothetical protein